MSKPDSASIKVRRDFGVWLKTTAATRGAFVYELLEELVSRQYGGKKPWRGAVSVSAGSAKRAARRLS
jgi:hypothetical protein